MYPIRTAAGKPGVDMRKGKGWDNLPNLSNLLNLPNLPKRETLAGLAYLKRAATSTGTFSGYFG